MKSAAAPEPSISRNFNGRLTAGGRSWKFRETKSRGHKENSTGHTWAEVA
jgi:hypothetical protein